MIDSPTRADFRPETTVEIVGKRGGGRDDRLVGDVLEAPSRGRSGPEGMEVELDPGTVGRATEFGPDEPRDGKR